MGNTSKSQAAAKAEKPTQATEKYTVVGTPVYCDTTRYEVGEVVELTEQQAKRIPHLLEPVPATNGDPA